MNMDRRNFLKLCSTTAALAAANPDVLAQANARQYARAQLVDADGKPLKAAALQEGANYLFHYPFVGTPALLLRLGQATARDVALKTDDGNAYRWGGGVGADRSVVAFSAICSHQLSSALRRHTFISYRHDRSPAAARAKVIVCCAHDSFFDPARGAAVVGGPARQPLAAVVLEHDSASDNLYATGMAGGELFHDFFTAFKADLIEEFGRGASRQEITDKTTVTLLSDYTKQVISC
jgi:arsenite oxidase small subunit